MSGYLTGYLTKIAIQTPAVDAPAPLPPPEEAKAKYGDFKPGVYLGSRNVFQGTPILGAGLAERARHSFVVMVPTDKQKKTYKNFLVPLPGGGEGFLLSASRNAEAGGALRPELNAPRDIKALYNGARMNDETNAATRLTPVSYKHGNPDKAIAHTVGTFYDYIQKRPMGEQYSIRPDSLLGEGGVNCNAWTQYVLSETGGKAAWDKVTSTAAIGNVAKRKAHQIYSSMIEKATPDILTKAAAEGYMEKTAWVGSAAKGAGKLGLKLIPGVGLVAGGVDAVATAGRGVMSAGRAGASALKGNLAEAGGHAMKAWGAGQAAALRGAGAVANVVPAVGTATQLGLELGALGVDEGTHALGNKVVSMAKKKGLRGVGNPAST